MSEPSIAGLIAELRAVAEKAAPGPWEALNTQTHLGEHNAEIADWAIKSGDLRLALLYNSKPANGRFIAAARTAVPILCDEIDRLSTADETRVRDISRLTIERDTARDELAAAKGATERIIADLEKWADAHMSDASFYNLERGLDWEAHMVRHRHSANALTAAAKRARAALQPKVETP